LRFIDLLVSEVKAARSELLKVILEPEDRARFYRELLLKRWHPLPKAAAPECTVYAVDSSDCLIELAGGGVIHVVRAAAISNRRGEVRKLGLHAFYPPPDKELVEYRKLVREHAEHVAALEAVRDLERGDALLVDGSLFGRMLHVFRPLRIPGREDFMVDYVETFSKLASECLRKCVLLVGVAKDSRSSLLRVALLSELAMERARELGQDALAAVASLLKRLRRRPRDAAKLLPSWAQGELRDILLEVLDRTPDYKVIIASGVGSGFSPPLRLELKRVSSGFMEAVLDPRRRRELAEKIAARLPSNVSEREVREALGNIASYPPVAALYVKLAEGDLPLRVDIVHPDVLKWSSEPAGFAVGEWHGLTTATLALLCELYAGPRNYNVLLTRVDRYVKMTRQSREQYKSTIESVLNTLIQQSRGVRRVSFP